jgi:predicted nucleotidyltransferase
MTKKIETIIKQINPVLKRYKVKKASIFGSFARGEENKKSDLDILVELGELGGLLTLVSLKRELEKVAKRKVDLITYRSVYPLIEQSIKKDEIKVYG